MAERTDKAEFARRLAIHMNTDEATAARWIDGFIETVYETFKGGEGITLQDVLLVVAPTGLTLTVMSFDLDTPTDERRVRTAHLFRCALRTLQLRVSLTGSQQRGINVTGVQEGFWRKKCVLPQHWASLPQ